MRASTVATAGAAAWVVPEILTAKPAAGASLSITTHGGGGGSGDGTNPTSGGGSSSGGGNNEGNQGVSTTPGQTPSPATEVSTSSPAGTAAPAAATTPAKSLAFTGIDIQRDVEIGAALVAGGWAMHHWASRRPKAAVEGAGPVDEAGSTDTPT